MGIAEKFDRMSTKVQTSIKLSLVGLIAFLFKVFTATMYALTITLVFQQAFAFGTFGFVLLFIVTGSAMIRFMWTWNLGKVLVFDLISVLVALLLRMYILMAP
jgi:hypothetical protein